MMISIVIPNYNGNRYLEECINSIYNQDYNIFEIIVIDNASTDSNYKWLAKYPNLIFKKLDKNYGFSRAVNEGIILAKGEYIILLNNDTVIKQGFIESLEQSICQNEQIFSVCSKMINFYDTDLIDDAGDEYNLLGWTLKCGDGKNIKYYTKPREVFSSCAGAAIYRKSIFKKIGYFDENFFAYMEDVDISYRARLWGYKNMYCPDAQVYHIGSATSGSKYNSFKVKLAARNNIYLLYKNMTIWQIIINSPFLLIGFIIKYLFFIRRGLGKEYRNGIREGITTLSKVNRQKLSQANQINYLKIQWWLIRNTWRYIRYTIGGPE